MSKQLRSVMAPKWHIPLRHPSAGMKVPRAGDLSSPLSDDSFSSIFGRTEPRCNGSGRKEPFSLVGNTSIVLSLFPPSTF
jgi:hypothetical protein